MVGLLDFLQSPQAQGLAIGLLNSSGYSTTPITFGQALGQGLTTANQFSQQDLKNKLQREGMDLRKTFTDAQINNMAAERDYRNKALGMQGRGLDLEAQRLGLENQRLAIAAEQMKRKANMENLVNQFILGGGLPTGQNVQPQAQIEQTPYAIPDENLQMSVMQEPSKARVAPAQPQGNDLANAYMQLGALTKNPALVTMGQSILKQEQSTPEVRAKIKEAEKVGTMRGEDLATFESMQSKLPELVENIDRLSELANTATYTTLGKGVDWLARQAGQTTQGGLARTEYESRVANQVLPLLRDTFGAAFTEKEGERLMKTLGDLDKTPEERKASLNAFIEQKVRDVESKARRLGVNATIPTETKVKNDPFRVGL